MNYLTVSQLQALGMHEARRKYKHIFQSENYYAHFSRCSYHDAGSQRLAWFLCEQVEKVDLAQFKTFDLIEHDVLVDGVRIVCNWPNFIPGQLRDLLETQKMRAENEAKRNNLKSPQVAIVPTSDPITMNEKSV